ncbi:hypothetical protein F2Q69_00045374 [Brassica cretica]|uniref:Uncharacterized protein n=1 Tax=Brassica cretica TaxID=69181 RepID=A0A8S9NQB2_BRACR|nr:hypothetical protein F2Q69_00045374 [Brassica cretica]
MLVVVSGGLGEAMVGINLNDDKELHGQMKNIIKASLFHFNWQVVKLAGRMLDGNSLTGCINRKDPMWRGEVRGR